MAGKDTVFVNGLIKSREKYLISEDAFLRMAEAASADDAFKILREYPFGGESAEGCDARDYEKLISAERDIFTEFLKEYADPKVYCCLLAKNDFHNAESVLRIKHVGADESILLPAGVVSAERLKEGKDVPDHLKKPRAEAEALFESGKATGAGLSAIFIKAYYSFMLKNVKNKDWKEILKYEIDAKNIGVALRQKDGEKAKNEYIDGGNLSLKILDLVAFGEDDKALSEVLRTPYYDLLKIGLEERAERKPLVSFEKESGNFAMKRLKEKRYETDGIIPLIVYANYKESEMKNVRVVLALKLAGADRETIRWRLKECYAG